VREIFEELIVTLLVQLIPLFYIRKMNKNI